MRVDDGDSVTRATQGEVGGRQGGKGDGSGGRGGAKQVMGTRDASGHHGWPPHTYCVWGLSSWPWGDRHGVAEPPHVDT